MRRSVSEEEIFLGKPVLSLQSMLKTLSEHYDIFKITPTSQFNENTKRAVLDFQKIFGLTETGVVDYETFNRINEEYHKVVKKQNVLKIRTFDENFIEIPKNGVDKYLFVFQYMMKMLHKTLDNLLDVDLTGVNDEKTSNSIKHYQKLSGMKENGKFNKEIAKHIADLFFIFVR